MSRSRVYGYALVRGFACFLAIFSALRSHGAAITWNGGGGNDNWSTNANWSAPFTGQAIQFGGTTRLTPFNDTTGSTVASIAFLNTAGAFVIGGNAFTLTGGMTNNDADDQTINNNITISANQSWFASSGNLIIGGTVALSSSATVRTLTLTGSSNLTLSNTISNGVAATGNITKTGTGTAFLGGTNTFTGVTTINAGTLSVGTIGNGGVAGNLGQATNAAANLVLGGGALQYTGATTSTNRNFTLTAATTNTFDVTTAGTTLTMSGASTNTTGALTKIGLGTLKLSGANLYTGTTTVTAGTLQYGVNNALSSGAVTVNGGTLDLQTFTDTVGAVTLTSGAINSSTGILTGTSYAMQSGSASAILAGAVALTKTTAGTVTLSGVNTFTGVTTINAGTLSVATIGNGGVAGNLGKATNAAANLVLGGGTLQYTGATASTNRSFTLTAGTTNTFDVTTAGTTLTISGASTNTTGALTKIGLGTLKLSGANLYTGTTTVTDGTLQYGVNSALSSGAVTVNGGTLDIQTFTDTVGAVTLSSGSIIGSTGVLTGTSYAMQSGSVSAILGGAVALTKTTAGTVTLSGVNTYTGVTAINAGTLSVGTIGNGGVAGNLGQATNAAANLVLGGGTLQYTGATASTNRNFTLTTGTTSSVDVSTAGTTLTISGASTNTTGGLTKIGLGTLKMSGANLYTGATTINAGTLSVGTIGNGGVAGNLGQATNAAANLVLGGGTLQYTGATASTNRNFTLTTGTTSSIDVSTAGTTLTISGASANTSGALTKVGAGALTLSGNNLHTGGTTLSAGTLNINSTTALGGAGSTFTIAGGTTFDNTSAGAITLANNNAQNWNGSFTFTGTKDLDLGTGAVAMTGTPQVTVTGGNLTVGGTISGTGGITKAGAGTLILSATNSNYDGVTTIQGGTLSVAKLNGGGSVSSIGDSTNNAANLVIDGGTLQFAGTTAQSTNRKMTVTTNGATLDASGSGTIDFSSSGALTLSGSGTRTLTFTGANTGSNIFRADIGESGGTTSLVKSGAGTWELKGSNSYSGATTITGGILTISSLKNGGPGNPSNIGDSTNAASNLVLNGGTLQYTGAAQSTDRLFTLGLGANAGGIDASGAGSGLSFTNTGSMGFTGSGARTLTLSGNNTNSNSLASLIGDSGGATSLTKSGTGTWLLTAANTYSGATTIDGGILSVSSLKNGGPGNPSNIGDSTNAAANLVLNGGTLSYTGGAQNTDRLFSVGTGGGSLDASGSGALAFTNTGNIGYNSQTGARVLTLTGSGTGSIAAVIGDNSGATSLVKSAAGQWTLSAANAYSGSTTINGGTLVATTLANGGAASAIGNSSNAASNLVLDGGTLKYTGGAQSTDRLFTLGSNDGTIDASGTGAINFTNTGSMGTTGTGARYLTLTGSNTGNNTLAAVILDQGGNNTNLIKSGAGTWVLAGLSTYDGNTTINGGILSISNIQNGGAGNSSNIGDSTNAASHLVLDGGTLQYTGAGNSTDRRFTVGLNGATFDASGTGAIQFTNTSNMVTTGTGNRTITLTGNSTAANSLAVGLTDQNANFTSLVKSGTGTWIVSGTNSFSGAASINNGILTMQNNAALGTGTLGTTVASGATLQLDGGLASATNGTLTLNGTGFGGIGALVGVSGNNRWADNFSLGSNSLITNNSTGYLALGTTSPAYNRSNDPGGTPTDTHTLALGSNTLTLSGSGTIFENARITGTGNVIVDMANAGATAWFTANQNTYTGTTTINNGTLGLATLYNTYPNDPAHPNFFGINGPIVIGDGTGAANSARLLIQNGSTFDEMINFGSTITLYKDGQLSLSAVQSIAGLTFNGGNVDLGTNGGLYLDGTVTVNASAGNTATITGTSPGSLSLTVHNGNSSLVDRIFDVTGGVGNTSDLTISAKITNGSLTKNGAGTMTITSDNTTGYAGTTTINNGILNIQNGNALGQANGAAGTGTTVNSGVTSGTLQLQGGIAVGNERVVLNGLGFNSNGALQNVSGSNSLSGPLIVNDARVQSDAGLFTASGSVTINTALEVTGAGDTTISGAAGGAGTLLKNGTGTLILSGNNNYGGTTTINTGVVRVTNANGLGSASTGTTVNGSGAALELAGNISTAAEPLNLNGTGISGNGALRNNSGTNTFGGTVTLQSASLITANSGTSLTLSGTLATAGQALTVGTSANNGDVTVSGNITGAGALTKDGAGTLTFSGTTGTVGATALNGGGLSVGSSSTLNTGALSSLAGTTLTIASGGTVDANYASGVTTFAGGLAGSGTFEKDGAGTLQFTSTISAPSLTLVLNGGTLLLSGVHITVGTIYITGNTVLDFNNTANTFLSSANLVIASGATVTVNNWFSVANNAAASTVWYATSTIGTTLLNGHTLTGTQDQTAPMGNVVFTGATGLVTTWTTSQNGWFDHEIRPTPEPSTYGAILLASSLGLLGWRRFRQNRKGPGTIETSVG